MNIEDVHKFAQTLRSGCIENVELDEDDEMVRLSLRDGVHEEPPQKVFIEARQTIETLRAKFGDVVKVGSEIIDEWIDVTVIIRK